MSEDVFIAFWIVLWLLVLSTAGVVAAWFVERSEQEYVGRCADCDEFGDDPDCYCQEVAA